MELWLTNQQSINHDIHYIHFYKWVTSVKNYAVKDCAKQLGCSEVTRAETEQNWGQLRWRFSLTHFNTNSVHTGLHQDNFIMKTSFMLSLEMQEAKLILYTDCTPLTHSCLCRFKNWHISDNAFILIIIPTWLPNLQYRNDYSICLTNNTVPYVSRLLTMTESSE